MARPRLSLPRKRSTSPAPAALKAQLRLDGETSLIGEVWLANRLAEWHGVEDICAGTTDTELRKARIREAIERHGLKWVICGRDTESRKSITWGEAFERLYGEKLPP
jgi:hypothetical protein